MTPIRRFTVGLISDTHDLLRPEAIEALRGSDHIIHAGDIGSPEILKKLARIAPVTAVRGNTDTDWGSTVLPPETVIMEVGELLLFLIHSNDRVGLDYPIKDYNVIVSGHTHIPEAIVRNDILLVNPGSAGPCRPNKPVSVGRLVIEGKKVTPHLIELDVWDA